MGRHVRQQTPSTTSDITSAAKNMNLPKFLTKQQVQCKLHGTAELWLSREIKLQ